MKVLLVTQDWPPVEGGMARYYADLAAGFDPAEILVSTVAPIGPGGPPPAAVPVARQPFPMSAAHRPLNLWRWRWGVARLVTRVRPDWILCGNLRPLGPMVASVAGAAGIPWHFVVHGNDLLRAHRRWSGWRRATWDRVTRRAAGWIANSQAVRALGLERCGLEHAGSDILPPEVDTGRFRPPAGDERRAARAEFGLPDGEPLLLFVGRLVERKGLDRLIDAMAIRALWPGGAPPLLAVAGFGDDSPWRRRCDDAGLSEQVRFLGAPADDVLPRLYRAADIAVVPSRTALDRDDIEGFGIVALEAQASGLPVVAGRSGGLPEAVADGMSGRIVDAADPAALGATLARLVVDGSERRRLGEAGRHRVMKEFGPGSMARRLRDILARSRAVS